MAEKIDEKELERDITELTSRAKKLEEARLGYEKFLAEKKAKAATIVPVLQAAKAKQDAIIQAATAERSRIDTQLQALGFGVKATKKGAIGARQGGLADKMKELVSGVGIGGTVTNADIQEHLGSKSGYVGMIIADYIEKGFIERTTPGNFKVSGVPV